MDLESIDERRDYETLIEEIRERVAADPGALGEPALGRWCARRWRDLFLAEAAEDGDALEEARRGRRDRRPLRRQLAERFLVGEGIGDWRLDMPPPPSPRLGGVTLLFCPGLLNGLLPVRAYEDELPALKKEHGWRVLRADCHPVRGCEANAGDVERAMVEGLGRDAAGEVIEDGAAQPPGDVVVLGYSKGVVDFLTLAVERPELVRRVRCFFSVAGPIGGATVADSIWRRLEGLGERAEDKAQDMLKPLMPKLESLDTLSRLGETDVTDAIRDLTTTHRQGFLDEHAEALAALPFPVFTLGGSTRWHEVPWFQLQGYLKMKRRHPDNDMQVAAACARLPGPVGVDLGLVHAHHWDLAYGPYPKHLRLFSRNLDHPFPRRAMLAAMVQLAVELGLVDQRAP